MVQNLNFSSYNINFKKNENIYMKSSKFSSIVVYNTPCLSFHCRFRTIKRLTFKIILTGKLTFEDNFDGYDNSKWSNNYERGNR